MVGRSRPLVAPLILAVVVVLGLASPAAADAPQSLAAEMVVGDEVTLTVGRDGVVRARETIVYEFAGGRGFDRTFVTRTRDSDTRDRVYEIGDVRASSPDGGPTGVSVSVDGSRTRVTVSGDRPLNGRRTVVLTYHVRGIVTPLGMRDELRWAAVGGWRTRVSTARVTVRGPVMDGSINCFAGPLASAIGCAQFNPDHTRTEGVFSQNNLLPGEHLTVVVGYRAGTVAAEPLYAKRRTLATAFSVNGITLGTLGALLALLLGGFGVLYLLHGRDKRAVDKHAAEGDRPAVRGAEFAPPDGVRPGQIGTLIDEQADVIDVTATIVDLAVRAYLLIEEEDRAATGRTDWTLRRLQRPVDDLLPYERLLLDALFEGRDSIKLSELDGAFAPQLARVRSAMYDDVVKQGWFARRPDTVRSRWSTAGIVLAVLGVAGTVALAVFTDLALVGLAVIIGGAALAVGGQYMPAKTARGATVLAHTIGFQAHLARGEAPEGIEGPQRIALFSRYLPYAVVFDLVDKWAKTVEDAGVQAEGADNLYWYEGPAEWDLSKFAESMRTFTLATSGAISRTRQFRSL
ncbi:DUF2207 domain-containing protein [Thermomonospora cellulosilytica]|uniref:DUF2207 domain-containing protein n=1 Tax=Thermomonospora cellulosilytica TaxID=1411118 RepID=A0A7W3MWM5_9ACTN|nr:DUF2207 domain-containing protein [Thermomonospora cellulosilytica]MBA9003233.1 hypothetical protein [Thermomonospora cellulosilytica]